MAYNSRLDLSRVHPGPFVARVTNNLDPTCMGGLEVSVIRMIPGEPDSDVSNIHVKYCSPFFGATSSDFEGNDSSKYNDVQKSYGMWMVPPDIGAYVLVIFIDGDLNQGFWIGCIPYKYQNHMVPGIPATRYTAITKEQRAKYGTDFLPVAELHRKSRSDLSLSLIHI